MPFVVGILESADDRGGGADHLRQLFLCKVSLRTEGVNLSCDRGVEACFFQAGNALGPPFVVTAVEDFDGVSRRSALLLGSHSYSASRAWRLGSRSNAPLRCRALSISRCGTTAWA